MYEADNTDTNSHQKFVYDVFRTTWLDFYRWEQDDYRRTLEALLSPAIATEPALLPRWIQPCVMPIYNPQDIPGSQEFSLRQTNAGSSDLAEIEILEYQTAMDHVVTPNDFTFTSVALKAPEDIVPCPQYEACAPLDQNLYIGDDPKDMPSLPFADDPNFNQMSYLQEYKRLSWWHKFQDPNLEVIATAAWNHCIYHGVDIEIVKGVLKCMLPKKKRRQLKRDFCAWNHPLLHQLKPKPPNAALRNIIMTKFFCRICDVGYCFGHYVLSPPVKSSESVPSDTWSQELDFCSESCCRSFDSSTVQMTWTNDEIEQLTNLLNLLPDTTPCYLAKMCRKPCVEVFMYRRKLLPDRLPMNQKKRSKKPWKAKKLEFSDRDPSKFAPNFESPCSHEGPCTQRSCPCNASRVHCTSKCLCDQKCVRRWNGCNCIRTEANLVHGETGLCLCVKNNRECDIEVCKKCQFITCNNVQMQMGQAKKTSVRQSQWGFGLFMEEPVRRNELIDEYVGEVISRYTAGSRGLLAEHRGRNYLFSLNRWYSIDSTYAGNATRYINHSSTSSNCLAKVWLVNGEHRIGITASEDIEAGEELFMDYGKEFFLDDDQTTNASTPAPGLNETDEKEGEARPVEDTQYVAERWEMDVDSSDETYKGESGSGSDSS